ncbi:MAG TPA: SDR family NAD(P)-dependent oxidoreductase, partial [Sphingomonas sp.]|nr:SDR family NAD(P)-dependent oxidoreductase [Sphingomonas sp.]
MSSPSADPRIVLITGAAAGIGLATAQAFRAAGDTVVLSDRDGETAVARAREIGATSVAIDVADEASIAAGVRGVLHVHGR